MPFELHLLRPLWLLALLPLGLLLWHWRRHQGNGGHWQDICDPRLLPYLLIRTGSRERRFPLLLAGTAGAVAILALAGPAWQRLEQPVFRAGSALVVALDLSLSMDSTDLTPNRLTRARLKLLDLLERRREGQTALIAYAGRAFAVTPLTDDTKTVAALTRSLDTGLMPSPGSRPDLALDLARELLLQAGIRSGEVLLIADSAAGPALEASVGELTTAGHRLHVLAVGTETGAPIPVSSGGFLKDANGAIVIPRLDEARLQRLADQGGGSYARLALDGSDLDHLLAAARNPRQDIAERGELQVERWREEGPWLLLLLLPLAALAFRRGYLLLAAILLFPPLPPPAQALDWPALPPLDWDSLWQRPDQQGARLLAAERPAEAAQRFDDPRWKAAAHYRAGAFEPAIQELNGSQDPEDSYNLGNALARAGRFQEALQAYDRTLAARPKHADARYNRDLVEQAMGLERPQPQNQQDNPGESDPQRSGQESGRQSPPQEPEGGHGQGQQQAQQPPRPQSDPERSPQGEDGAASGAPEPPPGKRRSAAQSDPGQGHGQEQDRAARQAWNEPADQDPEQAENRQATRQWLRRIPDDPGGLLRRKFQYQYRQQAPAAQESQTW